MARRGNFCRRRRALRGDRVGWLGAALSVPGEGEAVHAEGVGDEVEVLALVADAVGSAEPEGVVEVPVDGFGVVASFVERGEVQVGHGDGSDVLGAVEPASGVFVGAVEPDGDGAGAEAWREAVVVVPAILAVLVGVAVGADAGEFGEVVFAGVGEGGDADCSVAGEEVDVERRAVGSGDGALFDERRLRNASALGAARLPSAGFGGCDLVDRQQPEMTQEVLVMCAAQCGVVDDALGAGAQWCEFVERGHGGGGLGAGRRDPVGVDEANLDITWLRSGSLDDAASIPPRGVLTAESVEELEAPLAQFTELAASLPAEARSSGGSGSQTRRGTSGVGGRLLTDSPAGELRGRAGLSGSARSRGYLPPPRV